NLQQPRPNPDRALTSAVPAGLLPAWPPRATARHRGGDVLFGILGPLECPGRGCAHPPRHQKLLAALLVDAGRAVTVNDLMTAMWDGWPAATARTQIQGGVSALRRHFAEAPFAEWSGPSGGAARAGLLAGAGRPPRIEYGTVGYTLRLGAHEL